jgi:uncharacterized membrane protein
MPAPDAVFIYIGTHPSEAAARGDYDVVKDFHAGDAVGSYDATVITRDSAGKVHVDEGETATRHGAWASAAVGAVAGIWFPPALTGSATVGATVGGMGAVAGRYFRGRCQKVR